MYRPRWIPVVLLLVLTIAPAAVHGNEAAPPENDFPFMEPYRDELRQTFSDQSITAGEMVTLKTHLSGAVGREQVSTRSLLVLLDETAAAFAAAGQTGSRPDRLNKGQQILLRHMIQAITLRL